MEKERLAEHLERYHSGASNAATSRELECAFGIKGKELRDAVNALRREGVPIASNGSGYFYAATEQEVRATIAHLTHRDRRHRRGDPWADPVAGCVRHRPDPPPTGRG